MVRDLNLKNNGFPGELKQDGSVVGIKTHGGLWNGVNKLFDSAILIIRDPYAALVAAYNHIRMGHLGIVDDSMLYGNGRSKIDTLYGGFRMYKVSLELVKILCDLDWLIWLSFTRKTRSLLT